MILFGFSLHVCSLFLSDSMSSLSNGASDSGPKQGGILVVLCLSQLQHQFLVVCLAQLER